MTILVLKCSHASEVLFGYNFMYTWYDFIPYNYSFSWTPQCDSCNKMTFSTEVKIQCVVWLQQLRSPIKVQRKYQTTYGRRKQASPSTNMIRKWSNAFEKRGSITKAHKQESSGQFFLQAMWMLNLISSSWKKNFFRSSQDTGTSQNWFFNKMERPPTGLNVFVIAWMIVFLIGGLAEGVHVTPTFHGHPGHRTLRLWTSLCGDSSKVRSTRRTIGIWWTWRPQFVQHFS